MRPSCAWSALVFTFSFAAALVAQNPSSSTSQALPTLQSAFQALSGRTVINDVTLTGTAEWIVGSDDETGTVTYKTTGNASRLDLFLSSGTRSEIRFASTDGPAGSWISPDGTSHASANHNVMTDPGWFPTFALASLNSSANTVSTYVGLESRNGTSVIHISATQQFPTIPAKSATRMQHLTQVDFYLDPSTLLPVSYVYNSHPDGNSLLDIPTEIRYSNYRSVGGAQIPFRVQKFVNNTLALDLQFQNASLNTGVTAAQIQPQ